MHTITHPLPVGAYVLSIEGESDSYIEDGNGDDIERHTGPHAIGRIVDVDDYSGNGQGWSYAVEFPGGCHVHIDEADSINDPTKYRVFDAARMFAEVDRLRGLLVDLRTAADALDSKLDDPHGDGSGRDAQPPDGDSYNELSALIPSHADIQSDRVRGAAETTQNEANAAGVAAVVDALYSAVYVSRIYSRGGGDGLMVSAFADIKQRGSAALAQIGAEVPAN